MADKKAKATSQKKTTPPSPNVAARDPIVTVKVGPDETPFYIHSAFLTHYSEFFRGALFGSWTEAKDRVVPLLDVDVHVFNAFVEWLYTQEIPYGNEEWQKFLRVTLDNPEDEIEISEKVTTGRTRTYVFADKYSIPEWKRALLDHMFYKFKRGKLPFYQEIIYAYENLPPHDPLLYLFVDAHCQNWGPDSDDEKEKNLRPQLPHEFLWDLTTTYSSLAQDNKRKVLDRCKYHKHESEDEAKECREQYEEPDAEDSEVE